jgi:hypothetical protein
MRGNGVLLGGTLALLFSANAVLVLFYGLIGVSGNSLVTGGFLVLVPADYLFGAFLICVAMSFAVNGRTADVKEWGLVAVSLFAYPVCRLVPVRKFRTGFVWVSAAVVLAGAIVTAIALISQWYDVSINRLSWDMMGRRSTFSAHWGFWFSRCRPRG